MSGTTAQINKGINEAPDNNRCLPRHSRWVSSLAERFSFFYFTSIILISGHKCITNTGNTCRGASLFFCPEVFPLRFYGPDGLSRLIILPCRSHNAGRTDSPEQPVRQSGFSPRTLSFPLFQKKDRCLQSGSIIALKIKQILTGRVDPVWLIFRRNIFVTIRVII